MSVNEPSDMTHLTKETEQFTQETFSAPDDLTTLSARKNGYKGASSVSQGAPTGRVTASTQQEGRETTADAKASVEGGGPWHWSDRRNRLVEAVRRWAEARLMPFSGLVGLTADQKPVFYTPHHPKSGHVVFVFAQLGVARHYLDHLLYSFEATTPAPYLDVHIFAPHKPDSDDALYFREQHQRLVMDPRAAWLKWAETVQSREPLTSHWRTVHLLVVDDLHFWAEQARADAALRSAITTVLTRGLQRRVLVFATTTYRHWFTLPVLWRAAFKVGFYGGARGLAELSHRLPRSVQELAPHEALMPGKGQPVRFYSLAPELLTP